jgi:hypothetical protein
MTSDHYRSEYRKFKQWAKDYGFMGDFRAACRKHLEDSTSATSGDWAEAAETVWADTEAEFHYRKVFAC